MKTGYLCACAIVAIASPAAFAQDGVFVGVSVVRVNTEFGRVDELTIMNSGATAVISRAGSGSYDDSALALEFSVPIREWLSLDMVVTGNVEGASVEGWHQDSPPMPAPGSPAVVLAESESQSATVTASFYRAMGARTTGYLRAGAAYVRSELTISDALATQRFAHLERTDIRPWLALGARYCFDGGFTLNAEFGGATEGHTMARLGVGWTF